MEKNKQSYETLFRPETKKEINLLPQEINKKKKEIELIKKEINNIKEKLNIININLNKHNNEIIEEEKKVSKLLVKKYSIKTKQKMIINSINKEKFIILINNLVNIEYKNLKEIFLLFFNFKNEYKDELQFIIKNKESFIELMTNSYKTIKIYSKENINQFNEIKQKIINIISNNGYINIDKVTFPFNLVIEFIMNCFELINIKNNINEINEIINNKNIKKNSIFLNKIIFENNIQEKEQRLNNLEVYTKSAINIIEKYKNLKNQETEKEIIDMLSKLPKNSFSNINNKLRKQNKKEIIEKNKANYKSKKSSNNIHLNEGKEKHKSKNNVFSQDLKLKDKIQYIGNKINILPKFNKIKKTKELSCIEIYKNSQINKNNYSPKIKINTYITFSNRIKSVNSLNNNNQTINPKRKKFINRSGQINFDKSARKLKINRIFLPSNMTRINSINNIFKKNKNMINSYNDLLIKDYHKSPTGEISFNKSISIINDKILKTEGNKYININCEYRREHSNIFKKK